MPYVKRDKSGALISLQRDKSQGYNEFLMPTDAEVVAFLTSGDTSPDATINELVAKIALSESDIGFTRATEDLIHLLIKKNIILFTELPIAVQTKMAGREKLRSTLGDAPYSFLDDSDSI